MAGITSKDWIGKYALTFEYRLVKLLVVISVKYKKNNIRQKYITIRLKSSSVGASIRLKLMVRPAGTIF